MRSEPKTWQGYMRLMRAALRAMPKVKAKSLPEQVMTSYLGGLRWTQ